MRQQFDVFLTALMFFTRIPVPEQLNYTYHPDYLQQSSRYFSLIGWIVGGVSALSYVLFAWVLPPGVAVLLSMGVSILLTGAFHEDGWADVCDGFGGGMSKMRVLEIMKDSRLGTYGTIGLFVMLGGKWLALTHLAEFSLVVPLLLVAHPLSRSAAASLIYTHSYVRENEDSKAKPLSTEMSRQSLLIIALFGLLPLFLLPFRFWWVIAGATAVTFFMGRWFVRRIGGYTGDCLGAVQQVAELSIYLVALGLAV